MNGKTKYMVLILQYKEKDEENVDNLVESIAKPIKTKYGEIRRVYQGSEKRIISALESILKLTE